MQSFFLNRKSSSSSLNHPSTKRRGLTFEKFEDRHFMAGVTGVVAAELLGSPVALVAPEKVKASEKATPIMTLDSTLASSGDAASAREVDARTAQATTQQASSQKAVQRPDLDATIQAGQVTPTQAKTLNLLHFFGGEQVTVPVVIKNFGPAAAKGNVTVELYLSTVNKLNGQSIKLGSQSFQVNLANNKTTTVTLDVTIPSAGPKVGTDYFIVSKLKTSLDQSTINDIRATDRKFEFVGTPTNQAAFTAGADGKVPYFEFIRGTLTGLVIPRVGNPNFRFGDDPRSFLATFEGHSTFPFFDTNGRVTISTGIHITELSAHMEHLLGIAVRAYYKEAYGQTLTGSDKSIIALLKSQAHVGNSKQALSTPVSDWLFGRQYIEFKEIAETQLGKVPFARLNPMARIAVVDMIYDTGSLPAAIKPGLVEQDYVRAGFDLVNAKFKIVANEQYNRVGAEYQYLNYTERSQLGSIIQRK